MAESADLSELIKKAQEMINNNQVPDEIKKMAEQMSSQQNQNRQQAQNYSQNQSQVQSANYNQHQNQRNNSTNPQQNSTQTTPANFNIDANTMKQIQALVGAMNNSKDDDMSRLLNALKPYMRDQKKEKIDEYIKLIKMGNVAKILNQGSEARTKNTNPNYARPSNRSQGGGAT